MGIVHIADGAFIGTSLEDIHLSNTVRDVGNKMANFANNLNKVYFGRIIKSIGDTMINRIDLVVTLCAYDGTCVEDYVDTMNKGSAWKCYEFFSLGTMPICTHEATKWVVKQSSCDIQGKKELVCSLCGDVLE